MSVSRETVPAASASADRATQEHSSTPSESVSASQTVSRETGPLARLILLPIRGYRRFLSPALGRRCRYYPSCSAYAEQSVRELGAVRGTILAVWRVLRCNPLSKGGVDPVEERRLFRSAPAEAPAAHEGARHA